MSRASGENIAFLIVDAGEVWHTLGEQLERRRSCQRAFFDRLSSAVHKKFFFISRVSVQGHSLHHLHRPKIRPQYGHMQ